MSLLPAAILAGGRSSRMGGGDKCLLRLGRMSLLDRIIGVLAAQTDPILINSNSIPDLFDRTSLEVRADAIAGRLGPLAGIVTAMLWARERCAPIVSTVPSDTPFLPYNLAARLLEPCGGRRIAVASNDLHLHPTIGVWPVMLAERLLDDIECGVRSVYSWLMNKPFDTVPFEANGIDPFFNINTPSDREQANAGL
ncbi:MAG: molybdenum cofactor guanylyltransferase [Alphaproteobacteria bacterium]|nr:molybdenum cofactor guanylyltransferase [Alphaproteobacteria bacterium]MDE2112984.1 molybdenum cofactor guanylyltransferase [Alphaproteobacteria bacterium]MDE2492319.1 molybdenum cofactor guanylyltransferase [Alphaproteobacteria bacterium]